MPASLRLRPEGASSGPNVRGGKYPLMRLAASSAAGTGADLRRALRRIGQTAVVEGGDTIVWTMPLF